MSASIPDPSHGVSDAPLGRKARTDAVTASIPLAPRKLKSKSSTSSLSKFSNPRTKKSPHTHPHPRLKLALPPPPKSAEVFSAGVPLDDAPEDGGDEGQWFWYEGKRIYVRRTSKGGRRRMPSSEDYGGSDAEDGLLELAANGNGTVGDGGEETIGDDEYDCGWAMDLGAESPSISGSPAPGGQLDFGSSSFSSFSSSSSSSPSTPAHEESAPIASEQLSQSLSRRMTINNGPTMASPAKANGAGAVYKRDTEEETGDRLLREWAVAVAGKGEVVTPPVPSSATATVGRRSRGASVSQQLPPISGTHNRSRSSSGSGRRGSVSASNSNAQPAARKVWDDPADKDCGICFEYAVKPARTMCCGKIFCKEHLDDWLTGPNASGLCPNCDAPCSPEEDTLSLATPSLTSYRPSSSSLSKKSHQASSSSSTKTSSRQQTGISTTSGCRPRF